MFLKGVTHRKQRVYVAKEEGATSARRSLKVQVALRWGYKPVVLLLTGTNWPGHPANAVPYLKPAGKPSAAKRAKMTAAEVAEASKPVPYKAMSAPEYKDKVKEAFDMLLPERLLPPKSRPEMYLFHDRAKVHGGLEEWLEGQGITEVMLPPRSCDLDPLDYGIFGDAKRLWSHMREEGVQWDAACSRFKEHLEDLSVQQVKRVLGKLVPRMKAVIASGGGHIEDGDLK